MVLLAIAIFAFSSWSVFSKQFDDGIIAKHLLSFAGILAFLVIMDGQNHKAAWASGVCLALGILYAYVRPTRYRPLFHDRRTKQRPF